MVARSVICSRRTGLCPIYFCGSGVGLTWFQEGEKGSVCLSLTNLRVSPLLEVGRVHFPVPTSPIGQRFAPSWEEQLLSSEDYGISCYTHQIMLKKGDIAYRISGFDPEGRIWEGLVFLLLTSSGHLFSLPHVHTHWLTLVGFFWILHIEMSLWETTGSGARQALVGSFLLPAFFLSLGILDH